MRVLAIESSCDETSASIVENSYGKITVLSNVTATSLEMHAATGGIIPETASRMQAKYILPVIIKALNNTIDNRYKTVDKSWDGAKDILRNEIDAIAVTYGPGLIGSLLVGVETAKTLSFVFDKPLIPVNHLLAHIYANFVATDNRQKSKDIGFPFVGLIVSGGHTDLLIFKQHGDYVWLGGTRDDAAGEAFDKIGRVLGLPYPAGPEIERRANLVNKTDIKFKSPIMHEDNFDFSFSGLKTEVMRYAKSQKLDDDIINQICFATQKAIIDVLVKKTLKAAEKYNCKFILVGGGVSANTALREQLGIRGEKLGIRVSFPEKQYSTDNGAMIGAFALLNYKEAKWEKVSANPELYFA